MPNTTSEQITREQDSTAALLERVRMFLSEVIEPLLRDHDGRKWLVRLEHLLNDVARLRTVGNGITSLRGIEPKGGPLADSLFENIEGLKWGQCVAIEKFMERFEVKK